MSAYENLAASYDALTYDIEYQNVLSFMESILQELGKAPDSVLDLACGTGSMSALLAEKGYKVTGADISPEMLSVAYNKALELEDNRPMFICQPMQALRLPKPVDLVVCALDSINYLTNPTDCRETFRRVYQHLNSGGVFFFDINTAAKLRGLDGQIFLDENEDTYCVWRAEFEETENICYYGMDIFQREGETWRRSFEEHAEYAYEVQELNDWLRECGFSTVHMYGDCENRAPKLDEQRVYFVATKE